MLDEKKFLTVVGLCVVNDRFPSGIVTWLFFSFGEVNSSNHELLVLNKWFRIAHMGKGNQQGHLKSLISPPPYLKVMFKTILMKENRIKGVFTHNIVTLRSLENLDGITISQVNIISDFQRQPVITVEHR